MLKKRSRNFHAGERSADEGNRSRRHANGPTNQLHETSNHSTKRGNRQSSQAIRRTEAAEKAKDKAVNRNQRDRQPEPRNIKVEFIHVCDHAFSDANGRPCVNGIIEILPVPAFPHYRALATVAVYLRAKPNETIAVRMQFGGSVADLMRESPVRKLTMPSSGLVFIPFPMPQLRFDEPGEYVARIIDVLDDNYLMATKYIQVVLR